VELLVRRPGAPLIRAALAGRSAVAPHHVDAEVASALRGLVRRGDMPDDRARLALRRLAAAAIERFELAPLLLEAWPLRENLSVYDALYVALARRLGCPLLTADRRLAGAPDLGVTVTLVHG
jgi:predicted nucleic acid-binding protein